MDETGAELNPLETEEQVAVNGLTAESKNGPNVSLMEKYGMNFWNHFKDSGTHGKDTLKRLGDVPFSKDLKGLMKDNNAASVKFVEWTNNKGGVEWRYVLYDKKENGNDPETFKVMKKEGKEWIEEFKYPKEDTPLPVNERPPEEVNQPEDIEPPELEEEELEVIKKMPPTESIPLEQKPGFGSESLDQTLVEVKTHLESGNNADVELKANGMAQLTKLAIEQIETPDGIKIRPFNFVPSYDASRNELVLDFNAAVSKKRKLLGFRIPGIESGVNGRMQIGEAPADLQRSNIAITEVATNPQKIFGQETRNIFEAYLGGEGFEDRCDQYLRSVLGDYNEAVYTMTDEGNV